MVGERTWEVLSKGMGPHLTKPAAAAGKAHSEVYQLCQQHAGMTLSDGLKLPAHTCSLYRVITQNAFRPTAWHHKYEATPVEKLQKVERHHHQLKEPEVDCICPHAS